MPLCGYVGGSEDPREVKLPRIEEWYNDSSDETASTHAQIQALYVHGHAPESSGPGLGTFEPQVMLGNEDRRTNPNAGLPHENPTQRLGSPSSYQAPPVALLPLPSAIQISPLATKPVSADPDSPTIPMPLGAGRPGVQADLSSRRRRSKCRRRDKEMMQISVGSRIPTRHIKGKSPDPSQVVQAGDKKAQAEKHRKSEQERRKGTITLIGSIKRHIPEIFLDRVPSRSTKLRHTNDVAISISTPAKNGVLYQAYIYIKALEDELTAAYKRNQALDDTNAPKDMLTQEPRQIVSAIHASNGRPDVQYPTPPDSPKLNKGCRSANSLEAGGDPESPSAPNNRSRNETYDANAESTNLQEDCPGQRPKRHEGEAWSSNVLARMESMEHRPLRGSSDVSPRGAGGDGHSY